MSIDTAVQTWTPVAALVVSTAVSLLALRQTRLQRSEGGKRAVSSAAATVDQQPELIEPHPASSSYTTVPQWQKPAASKLPEVAGRQGAIRWWDRTWVLVVGGLIMGIAYSSLVQKATQRLIISSVVLVLVTFVWLFLRFRTYSDHRLLEVVLLAVIGATLASAITAVSNALPQSYGIKLVFDWILVPLFFLWAWAAYFAPWWLPRWLLPPSQKRWLLDLSQRMPPSVGRDPDEDGRGGTVK